MKGSLKTERVWPTCDRRFLISFLLAIKLFVEKWKQKAFYFDLVYKSYLSLTDYTHYMFQRVEIAYSRRANLTLVSVLT